MRRRRTCAWPCCNIAKPYKAPHVQLHVDVHVGTSNTRLLTFLVRRETLPAFGQCFQGLPSMLCHQARSLQHTHTAPQKKNLSPETNPGTPSAYHVPQYIFEYILTKADKKLRDDRTCMVSDCRRQTMLNTATCATTSKLSLPQRHQLRDMHAFTRAQCCTWHKPATIRNRACPMRIKASPAAA